MAFMVNSSTFTVRASCMVSTPQSQNLKVASPPARINPEKLTEVPINNGRDQAVLVREIDPKGAIVVHPVKKSAYVHDRMHDLGRIDDEMYDAAEIFRKDFERAHLEGRFASIDLFRSAGGTAGEVSDAVAEARLRVKGALHSLGMRKSGKSLSQSCIWFTVGCGHTFENWSLRMRNSGENMSEGKAAGVLYGALEKLAWHYGLVNTRTIKDRATNLASVRSRKETLQEVITLAELSAVGDAKEAMTRFTQMLKEKVAKIKTAG